MKQITEIDDPRLVKALAHPLRIEILHLLQDRTASPSEIAGEIGAPLGNVSYHVRFLARLGLIELAGTEPRRGAVEHYYRAVGRVRVSQETWAQVPQSVRATLLSSTLEKVGRAVGSAAAAGGFDRLDAHASRSELTLDEAGFRELAQEIHALTDRALTIERESLSRLAAAEDKASLSERSEASNRAGLVLMLFDGAAETT